MSIEFNLGKLHFGKSNQSRIFRVNGGVLGSAVEQKDQKVQLYCSLKVAQLQLYQTLMRPHLGVLCLGLVTLL